MSFVFYASYYGREDRIYINIKIIVENKRINDFKEKISLDFGLVFLFPVIYTRHLYNHFQLNEYMFLV